MTHRWTAHEGKNRRIRGDLDLRVQYAYGYGHFRSCMIICVFAHLCDCVQLLTHSHFCVCVLMRAPGDYVYVWVGSGNGWLSLLTWRLSFTLSAVSQRTDQLFKSLLLFIVHLCPVDEQEITLMYPAHPFCFKFPSSFCHQNHSAMKVLRSYSKWLLMSAPSLILTKWSEMHLIHTLFMRVEVVTEIHAQFFTKYQGS